MTRPLPQHSGAEPDTARGGTAHHPHEVTMADAEQAPGPEDNLGIDFPDLKEVLDELDDTKHAVDEANGRHRSRIKEIVQDRNWNKKALSDIRAIHNMSETGRADYLRTYKALFDVMWEEAWRAETRDMLSKQDDEAEQDEAA